MFSHMQNAAKLSINLLANLLHCGILMHTNKIKNRETRVILSEVKQEKFSIYLIQFLNEY